MQFPAAGFLHSGGWSPWELRRSHALRGIGRRTRDQSTTRGARAQRPSARSREGIKRQGADFLSRSPVLLSPLARLPVPSCHFFIGHRQERGALFFQIRQAFPPGEVTPEEANKIGYETAMRWTKGTYQFFVCTHIDKSHIHNHIYYNSTAQDCSRKFHNFIGSSFAVRRLSDQVCIEHELSIIQNPKQHSKGRFLHYRQWIGEKPPSAQQRVRLGIVAALEQKPADLLPGVSAAHGGVRLFCQAGTVRCNLIPCAGAAAGHPAPLVHSWGRL